MKEPKREKPNRRVRLEDVARKCGVSVSTASRALTGTPGVKDPLRDKIIAAAKSLNYAIPKPVEARKVMLAASSVAMIDSARSQFTMHVLNGLQERAQSLGMELVNRPVTSPDDARRILQEAEADPEMAGCLFLTLDDEETLTKAHGFSKPIVLVNGDDPLMRHSSVTPCNRSSAHMATDHLLDLGHRRILFLVRRGRRTIERRLEGWRDALLARNVPDIETLVIEVDDWLPELAEDAIGRRLAAKGGLDYTAILAAGDSLAFGAMRALQMAGYDVPREVSIMGMDDLPLAAFCNPPLTTMHIPMHEIGTVAFTLLMEEIGIAVFPPRRTELACTLVERASTRPPVSKA